MREHPQTVDEIRAPSVDDDLGIGGQRIGVHRGHEDRARTRTRRGHLAERARAQCGPQAGGHQGRFDRHGVEIAEFFRRLRIEGDLVVCVRIGLEPDHDRLKNTLGAAIDRNHLAGTRRGIAHARRLLVLEQRLAQLDEIAFGDKHRGLHAMVVDTDYRHPTDRRRVVNDLAWRAADRQIQTFLIVIRMSRLARLASLTIWMVPTAGLEPAQLSLLPPQDSVSTNSTTSA